MVASVVRWSERLEEAKRTRNRRSKIDMEALKRDVELYPLEYLPPYSPDLNPIEHKWAHSKAL